MTGMSSSLEDTPLSLDDVRFLVGSDARVRVLEALNAGPVERHVLRDDLGVSQPTMSRTLTEFEARNWVTHEGRTFSVTPLGGYVASAFAEFREKMDAADRLRDVAQWFPADGFGFDLECLETASITVVSEANLDAPARQLATELREADHVRSLSHAISGSLLEASWDAIVGRGRTGEWVFDGNVLEVLQSVPSMATQARESLETGRIEYLTVEGAVPYNLVIADDTVNLCLTGGQGAAFAEIQSDDPTVRAWAESVFGEFRRDAEPVTLEAFTD